MSVYEIRGTQIGKYTKERLMDRQRERERERERGGGGGDGWTVGQTGRRIERHG